MATKPSTPMCIVNREWLCTEEDGLALLGILMRSRKLEQTWSSAPKAPFKFYTSSTSTGAMEIGMMRADPALLAQMELDYQEYLQSKSV